MPLVMPNTCPGSLTLPELEALPVEPDRWVGRCRECGVELSLGYAGLLPVHAPAERDAGAGSSRVGRRSAQ